MRGIPRARKLHALVAKIESRRFVTASKEQTATDVKGRHRNVLDKFHNESFAKFVEFFLSLRKFD
jgi:hypothetical protein